MNNLTSLDANEIYSLGLMSGTSLDGIDIAYVKHEEVQNDVKHTLIHFATFPYDEALKAKIFRNLSDETSKISEICELNKELGIAYRDAIKAFLKMFDLSVDCFSFIAIHGQTMYHNPNAKHPSTLQLGDMSEVSLAFNKTVVYDFRSLDTAALGQGAPLVPIVNYELFKNQAPVMLLNIGGISNITYLPDRKIENVIAFDTGPGNMLVDDLMQELYNLPYDEDGKIAKSGELNEALLNYLLNDDYYEQTPPKSTGREKYNHQFVLAIIKYSQSLKLKKADIIKTVTHLTSLVISQAIDKFIKHKNYPLIVSGGGTHNQYMMDVLKEQGFNVLINDDTFSDGLEAYSFAILGYLRLKGKYANMPNVTGAHELVRLGSIILPPKEGQ